MQPLDAVAIVTPEHGEKFAREWSELSVGATDVVDAFAETDVLPWPDDDREAQMTQADIVDEIISRTFEEARPAVAEAFVKAANAVLTEERKRGHVR